jgi:hypothetical protein
MRWSLVWPSGADTEHLSLRPHLVQYENAGTPTIFQEHFLD